MITIENNVGRLLEIRQTGSITLPELQESFGKFQQIMDSKPGSFVFATDWRGMRVLAPQVSDILVSIMKADNARAERQAVIIDDNAIVGLQIERMFREGGGKTRAVYREAATAATWLGELLSITEQARLRKFLGI